MLRSYSTDPRLQVMAYIHDERRVFEVVARNDDGTVKLQNISAPFTQISAKPTYVLERFKLAKAAPAFVSPDDMKEL